MPAQYSIACCQAAERTDVLRLLYVGLPEDQQTGLAHALAAVRGEDEAPFTGLLVARDAQKIQAAVWIQLAPGHTAVVWPPPAGHPASSALMHAAAVFLDQHDVALAQILAHPDTMPNEKTLADGDFHPLANLVYLTVENSHFPQACPEGDLQFEPQAYHQSERLGKLLLETYEGSLDCPALNGMRRPEDILEGYADQGALDTNQWYFIRHNQEDVGTLILTSHAQGENWELVYMGIVPTARGKGFGWQTLQHAMWQSRLFKAQRMVLAVDEMNEHALRTYRRAGFVVWDRRTVFARLRG
ncbi:MAG: GNAT family N-acetyltransferase [Pirellulales bacterium]|nr:GNAT family N-acetyltransferase [Pirellulales bacterium]